MARPATLCIAMVGLPAMGKSTVASKIKENLEKDDIKVGIFNNGDVRRRMVAGNTSHAGFYDPDNADATAPNKNMSELPSRKAITVAETEIFGVRA